MNTAEKKEYWERRKFGLRGQGEEPSLVKILIENRQRVGGSRENRRKKIVDKLFNKKGYRRGVKIKCKK